MNVRPLVDGLDHPEGVAYDPGAHVVWAGGEAGRLYRVDPDAGVFEQAAEAPGCVLGLAVDGRRRLAVCASGDGSLCGYDGASVRRLVTGLVQPNHPAFAPDGTLYVSASGTGRWHLTVYDDTGLRGAPLHRPRRWAIDG